MEIWVYIEREISEVLGEVIPRGSIVLPHMRIEMRREKSKVWYYMIDVILAVDFRFEYSLIAAADVDLTVD